MPPKWPKKDALHNELTEIGQRLGFHVQDTHRVGPMGKELAGFGDALWVWDGITVMVEYKSASGELTPDEKRFRDAWPGPYAVIRSEWDAVELRERLLDDEREIEV